MSARPMPATLWMNLDDASARYGVPAKTLRGWVAAGKIRGARPGRRLLLDASSLDRLFEASARGGRP